MQSKCLAWSVQNIMACIQSYNLIRNILKVVNHTVYTQINIRTKNLKAVHVQVSSVQTILTPPFVMFPQVRALLEVW